MSQDRTRVTRQAHTYIAILVATANPLPQEPTSLGIDAGLNPVPEPGSVVVREGG